jgi:hypothetical protein
MDTTLTVGSGAEIGAGPAVTETPAQTSGSEPAASESGAPASSEAGPSQERPEDSQSETTQKRPWSKVDEIRELRAWRREARQRESTYQDNLRQLQEEVRLLRESSDPRRRGGTERNPATFWQDPEGTLESKLDERLERLQNNMFDRFQTSREQEYAQQALTQERGQAVEFIRSQKDYQPEDDEDLIEIIESRGLAKLQPMDAATTAWALLQQERGVGGRSLARNRASTAIGQPPGAGFGKKIWSGAEYDRVMEDLLKAPSKLTPELEAELLAAAKEGRVR